MPASAFVTAMFDDHHLVVMAPAMIAMHPVITMHMIVMPDHDGLGTCNRRRGNSDRAKRGDNVSKLLHVVLLHCARIKHHSAGNVPGERQEIYERMFSLDWFQ
jgi:hypothetical protein